MICAARHRTGTVSLGTFEVQVISDKQSPIVVRVHVIHVSTPRAIISPLKLYEALQYYKHINCLLWIRFPMVTFPKSIGKSAMQIHYKQGSNIVIGLCVHRAAGMGKVCLFVEESYISEH